MARYEVDHDGIGAARSAISDDPALLRAVAMAVSAASGAARSAVGPGRAGLVAEIDRFGLLHARLLDALADAVQALCGDLDLVVQTERETELAAASALGGLTGAVPAVAGVGP
jgi:hypothetical protein